MLFRILCSMLIALFCSACQNKQDQSFTRFYDDGVAKPVVAISPVIDSSSYELPWSLSEELTQLVVQFSSEYKSLYIPSKKAFSQPPRIQENPFTGSLSWVKKQFAPHEFVVFLEVLEHANQPIQDEMKRGPAIQANATDSSKLLTSCRIRIVDIRKDEPKVVLQEIIQDSFYVNKSLLPVDYTQVSWGTSAYEETPLAIAHERLAKELVERIHDYVLLAKSR